MLQRFLPLLIMTFFICLFIVLMQFLFRMIDDLVGKGLSFDVLGELFFYAALTMVPTALPLAVLLASLMVFGNLGEKLELTAMKAAGISLFRIMRPLIILMTFIAIGAFFFQNNVLPVAQSRMWTLMFSVRQKTPEVEIPEKSFYDEIPNMNLYIDHKNPETGMLYGMILYDLTKGNENARVILADSGKFSFTEDKTRLFLELHHGEMFENLNDNSLGSGTTGYMPFRREGFSNKQIYFPFDANFNRMDESGIRSQYVGQNISQLRQSIDSISRRVDSIGTVYSNDLLITPFVGVTTHQITYDSLRRGVTTPVKVDTNVQKTLETMPPLNLDSVFTAPTAAYAKTYLSQALTDARRSRQEFEYRALTLTEQAKLMRRHDIEMQRKFTLSFAVLVFFFIGAPLGAIIKKGGLGTPLVISVFLFIIYYIFDNMGYKMAREGRLPVWEGMWLSTGVLLPLGIFFTSKAIDDSAVFNADAYKLFFNRLIGRLPKRTLELKEIVMNEVEAPIALQMLEDFKIAINDARQAIKRRGLFARIFAPRELRSLRDHLNAVVEYLSNTTDAHVIIYLNKYPFEPACRNIDTVAETTDKLLALYTPDTKIENTTD